METDLSIEQKQRLEIASMVYRWKKSYGERFTVITIRRLVTRFVTKYII